MRRAVKLDSLKFGGNKKIVWAQLDDSHMQDEPISLMAVAITRKKPEITKALIAVSTARTRHS